MTMLSDDRKFEVLVEYAREYGLRQFVETGSATGATTANMVPFMDRLLTVEIDYDRYLEVLWRFADEPKVVCIHGESERILADLMRFVQGPFLFWLDAHDNGTGIGSAGRCPVIEELQHILYAPARHVILIDDARFFGVDLDYPTIDRVAALVGDPEFGQSYRISVADDIIRCVPK